MKKIIFIICLALPFALFSQAPTLDGTEKVPVHGAIDWNPTVQQIADFATGSFTESGVDSVTYSNDSAFVWAGGTAYFSGITYAPRPNSGRIWYVSKSNPACSAAAVVGDPTRPFCNPWQAYASLAEGDLVEIYPANYRITNTGVGGDVEVSSNWSANCNLYKDNVTYFSHSGVVITQEASTNQAIFNTNGVVTTTAGKSCAFVGLASLKRIAGVGRLDLSHDLTTGTAGNILFQIANADISGGGFDNRVRERVDVNVLGYFNYNNQLYDAQGTKSISFKSNLFKQTSNLRPALSLESSTDGMQIVIEGDEFIVSGTSNGSIFTYGGSPSGNDSLNFTFKVKRLKFLSNAQFNTGTYNGKLFSRNSTGSTGNNKMLVFDIGEIIDLSSDTMPIFNLHNAAFTDGARVFVDIKKGYSAASLWTANIASNCVWRFNVGQWNNAGSKPVFGNYVASTSGELWILGNYTSPSSPVLRLSANRLCYVNNAILNTNNQTAIFTNSANPIVQSSNINTGTAAPIQNISTTPLNISLQSVFTNSGARDTDIRYNFDVYNGADTTWTPTVSLNTTDTLVAVRYTSFQMTGNVVDFSITYEVRPTLLGGIPSNPISTHTITLPVQSNFLNAYDVGASCTATLNNGASFGTNLWGGTVYSDASTDKIAVEFINPSMSISGAGGQLLVVVKGQYTKR